LLSEIAKLRNAWPDNMHYNTNDVTNAIYDGFSQIWRIAVFDPESNTDLLKAELPKIHDSVDYAAYKYSKFKRNILK
jgi:hypothetical protein